MGGVALTVYRLERADDAIGGEAEALQGIGDAGAVSNDGKCERCDDNRDRGDDVGDDEQAAVGIYVTMRTHAASFRVKGDLSYNANKRRGETTMSNAWASLEAEYQGNGVEVVSTDPLIGRLELMAEQEEVVEVTIDRATAEQLISALMAFLAHGEGDDAPNFA